MSKIVTGLAAAALLACLPGTAHAAPTGGACPGGAQGFALWDVSTEPYGVDNFVDERGNNDGWACAKPINVVIDDDGSPFQIYNFLDNRFQAHG